MHRSRPKAADYLVCYALFVLLVALCYAAFQVWRIALQLAMLALLGQTYANQLLYAVGMLLIGIALFFEVLAAEPYLRRGVVRRQVLPRFVRLAVPVCLAVLLGLALRLALTVMV